MDLITGTRTVATRPADAPATPAAGPTRRAASAPPRSALYECRVMHHRLAPTVHQFVHHIFLLALDLDEVDDVADRVRGFARNGRAPYEFRDRDHLTVPGVHSPSLKDHLLAWISAQNPALLPADPSAVRVTLLTLPRVFGYVFNPVSFYFLHHAATGRPLCAVAEVRNTFGELKPYLLENPGSDDGFRLRTPKHFYVSPFSRLDLHFDFKLLQLSDTLEIHVDDYDGDAPVLLSALTGRRRPLTTATLWKATLVCPLVTLKVIALIHWHAFRLWLKRIPWHPKADRPDLQRHLFHPHPSLSGKQP